jgi:hypothetical protein
LCGRDPATQLNKQLDSFNMARRYRVVAGTHNEGGREYVKGDVIVSESDLVKLFVGKFEDMGPSTTAPQPAKPASRGSLRGQKNAPLPPAEPPSTE